MFLIIMTCFCELIDYDQWIKLFFKMTCIYFQGNITPPSCSRCDLFKSATWNSLIEASSVSLIYSTYETSYANAMALCDNLSLPTLDSLCYTINIYLANSSVK